MEQGRPAAARQGTAGWLEIARRYPLSWRSRGSIIDTEADPPLYIRTLAAPLTFSTWERASERDGGIAWLASTRKPHPARPGHGCELRERTGCRSRRLVMLSVVLLVLGIVAAWLIVNTLMNRASRR